MNYYSLSSERVNIKIEEIRNWIFNNPTDERLEQAVFALDIALIARSLKAIGTDEFTDHVIDFLCNI